MSTSLREENEAEDRLNIYKTLFKQHKYPTIAYLLMFGLVGMSSTYLGPCLETMRCQINASEKFMTVVFAAQLFSMLLGTMITGLLNKIIGADLLLSVSGVTLVISTAVLGFSRSVDSFLPILSINGLSTGCIDCLCNLQMINLFGENVGPFMQAMHFMFAFSAFIVLLISAPFISLGAETCEQIEKATNGSAMSTLTPLYGIISGLEVPAVICVIVLSIYGTWRCVGYRHDDECEGFELTSREAYTELEGEKKVPMVRSFLMGFLILAIVICMTFIMDGIQGEYNGYIFEYAIKVLDDSRSKQVSGYLTCCFWAFFAFGRLISIFVATRLKTSQLLIICMVGLTLSTLPLIIVSNHIVPLFIETSLFGLFLSNAVPAIYTIAEETIDLTRCKVTALIMGSALGEACMPLIVGALVNNVRPIAFPIFNFVVVMLVFVFFIMLIYLGSSTDKGLFAWSPLFAKKSSG